MGKIYRPWYGDSLDYPATLDIWTLKRGEFSQVGSREESRRGDQKDSRLKRTWFIIAGFAYGEKRPLAKEYGQPMKTENNPWPTATKKCGPQSYSHIGLHLANSLNEQGSEYIPEP